MDRSRRRTWQWIWAFTGLSLVFAVALFNFLGSQMTDRPIAHRFESTIGQRVVDVKRNLGRPLLAGACKEQEQVSGYARPSFENCRSFLAYHGRFGIFYLFTDGDRVIRVQWCGG